MRFVPDLTIRLKMWDSYIRPNIMLGA